MAQQHGGERTCSYKKSVYLLKSPPVYLLYSRSTHVTDWICEANIPDSKLKSISFYYIFRLVENGVTPIQRTEVAKQSVITTKIVFQSLVNVYLLVDINIQF